MKLTANRLQLFCAAIGVAAVIVGGVVAYLKTYNDLRVAETENERLKLELSVLADRTNKALTLIERAASDRMISLGFLSEHLTPEDASEISRRVLLDSTVHLPCPLESHYSPSGWMGDGRQGENFLRLSYIDQILDGNKEAVLAVEYRRGPNSWAGVFWLYPEDNWGRSPGKSLTGARSVTFRARGEHGGEIVEFKAGGIRGEPFSDTFERSLGKVTLDSTWQDYHIDLSGADLSNVIGAFAWSAPAPAGDTLLKFYLADLWIR